MTKNGCIKLLLLALNVCCVKAQIAFYLIVIMLPSHLARLMMVHNHTTE